MVYSNLCVLFIYTRGQGRTHSLEQEFILCLTRQGLYVLYKLSDLSLSIFLNAALTNRIIDMSNGIVKEPDEKGRRNMTTLAL